MAGHSKFANIKRKKEKNDAKRGKIFTQLGKELAVAVKLGGPDPNANTRLKIAIGKAKANNMPNDTIERSIKKAAGNLQAVNYESIRYEGYGPKGVAVIVDCLTDNKNRAAANVRAAFTKAGGNMGNSNCVSYMFDRKAVFFIEKQEHVQEDDVMLLAMEHDCEEFVSEEEGYEIIANPETFDLLKASLEKAKVSILDAEITMIAQTNVILENEDDIKKMNKLLELLEEEDDVQDVYHNWKED